MFRLPIPNNTLPMMTGTGPFGPVGTLANEYTAEMPEAPRTAAPQPDEHTLRIRKPGGHSGH